jgi:FAD:protein FMN transferase
VNLSGPVFGRRILVKTAVIAALGLLVVWFGAALADDVYLSDADAPAAVFPTADRFERREVPATDELRARVARRLGDIRVSVWEQSYKTATAFRGEDRLGRSIEVEEIGKHRAITFVVGVDERDEVAGVAVMVYREAYGGEIRSRRFLDQYHGKTIGDPLRPGQDVHNITGATLSARAAGRAVKKAIAVLEEIGEPKSPAAALAPPLPPAEPAAGSPAGERLRVREAHYVMGTILEVTVDAPSLGTGRAWIRRAVGEARRLDAELTSFRSDSALCRLNRQAGRGFQRVPPDLYRVVVLSQELSAASEGAFDITVDPLVRLWQRAANERRWPSSAELALAQASIGRDKVRVRAPDQVELAGTGVTLDLGGVGKGYGADRIAALLRELGADSALVNFGESSIVAVGPPPVAPAWTIRVRRGSALDGPLFLRDMALSTSESFGQGVRVGRRRFGHIIDPRTGMPLERSAQATALAPTGTEAEAWSKALLVDPERALRAVAARPSIGALLIDGRGVREDDRFAVMSGWRTASR